MTMKRPGAWRDFDPVELLRRLVRFDTANPPGNEGECLRYIRGLLAEWGLKAELLGRLDDRPNLVARVAGRGEAPPLLMQGHVDVVTADEREWRHPPFEGRVAEGCLWGRGALDMKGGIVMMLSALRRAVSQDGGPPGDVALALVGDEEAGGELGARFLVENRPDLFAGIRYAIGEFGGFSFQIGPRRFYPVMVAEKQSCHLRLRIGGPSGHGSLDGGPGAMARLAEVLNRLEERRLPIHATPAARMMVEAIGAELTPPASLLFRAMPRPALTGAALKLMGKRGSVFGPLFRNTVNATMVSGGRQINVTPGEIVLDLDGRLLPGFGPEDLVDEVRGIVGDGASIEVVDHLPGPASPDMGLFPAIGDALRRVDPEGVPVPMLLPAATDARHFAKLGIQTYGFLPMRLPPGFDFMRLVHGPDERIPLEALDFGADAIYQLMQRMGESPPP